MKLGKILENITQRKVSKYSLNYDQKHGLLFNSIKEIPELSELKVSPILLITNKNPDTLIAIAYAVKIINSLGKDRKLYALTEGKHSDLIINECKEYEINLIDLVDRETINIEDITQMVTENDIGLIIVSYGHHLWKTIISEIPVSVLVTSLKNIYEKKSPILKFKKKS